MAYRHNDAFHKHKVRAHRWRKAAFVAVILVFIAAVGIAVDWFINQTSSSNTVVTNETTTSVQSANVSVYRTEFFQFQASENWKLIEDRSSDKTFVYVKDDGNLITQRLIVYIDRPLLDYEADFKGTHVMPVELGDLGRFINIGEVTDHCDTSWPETLVRNPSRIEHQTVSLVCSPGSKQYNVVIGEYGGDDVIDFVTNDGRQVTMTIVYSDLTAYPSSGDLRNIISSFNTL